MSPRNINLKSESDIIAWVQYDRGSESGSKSQNNIVN